MKARVNPGRLVATSLVLLGLLAGTATQAGAQTGEPPADPSADAAAAVEAVADVALGTDQLIVKFRGTDVGITAARLTDLSSTAAGLLGGERLELVRTMDDGSHVLRLPTRRAGADMAAIAKLIAGRADIALAEPDLMARPTLVPNDPRFTDLWSLSSPLTGPDYGINAPAAWDFTTGDPNLRVAVLDTGQLNHPDLAGRFVTGYDMVSDFRIGNDGTGRDGNPADPGDWITPAEAASGFFAGCPVDTSSWHGTHVAGTIGATANNATDVVGINWQSKVQHVRVLGKCGGFFSDISDGVRWAAGLPVAGVPANTTPARVINLSLGGFGACPAIMQSAINAATAAGTVVVVAAGNSNSNAVDFTPANCANVVTVASTGKAGSRAFYSNFGATVEIAAPGGDSIADAGDTILSTLNAGATSPGAFILARYQGTSMATPHVAGVVSLMLSADPSLTPAQVTTILRASSTPFPAGSTCSTTLCGAGIVSARFAVAQAAGAPDPFRKTAPANNAVNIALRPTLKWTASPGVTRFEYCIDTINNGLCDTNWVSTGTARQVKLPANLARGSNQYWAVRAVNAVGVMPADAGLWHTFRVRN